MKIYITDLAAYNAGKLVGEWVSLPMDEDNLHEAISEVLSRGSDICKSREEHEEIFITDFESEIVTIDEYDDILQLNEVAEQLEWLNEEEIKIIKFLLNYPLANNITEALEEYCNYIIHENMEMKDIAYNVIAQSYDFDSLPSMIVSYIDYESLGKDMKMDGRYYEENGDIYECTM